MTSFSQQIKDKGHSLGFSRVGIVAAEPGPHLESYLRWLGNGYHAEMGYLSREDRVARRKNLDLILPGARSLVVAAMRYPPSPLPVEVATDPLRGRISAYAWGADYHDVMLETLNALAEFVKGLDGDRVTARAYVDTGAFIERSHAQRAGLGFFGKNTMLIHPRAGSNFFLGEIITTAALEPDLPAPMPNCGTCSRCLSACPTQAFPKPYTLDSRRCVSYLTIEHKGMIAPELRQLMGNWVYGCDVCQEVCPWQRFAGSGDFHMSYDRCAPLLADLLPLDDTDFEARFSNTAIFRVGRDRLVRNACIAAGNSASPDLANKLISLLSDSSSLVRGHAAWALGRLGQGKDDLRKAMSRETDPAALGELRAALRDSQDANPQLQWQT